MQLPDAHAIAVMLVAASAFFLYSRSWIRVELVSLLLLLALVLLFHFFPLVEAAGSIDDSAVLGAFGHPVLIAILCLMVLGRGLISTGALEPVVRMLTRLWKWSPGLGLLVTLISATLASAFVNDTPVMVMLIPMLLGIADRTSSPATRTLMPVNFAVLGGGMLTAMGTSTNLLVLSIAGDLGMKPIGLFGFATISAAALLIALPYLWLVAPRLLPARTVAPPTPRLYEAHLKVSDAGGLLGRTLQQVSAKLGRGLPLVRIQRGGKVVAAADDVKLAPGDELVLTDTAAGLREIAATFSIELSSRIVPGEPAADGVDDDLSVVELVLGAASPQVGKTLSETRFAEQFDVVVIAVHRTDEDLLRATEGIGDVVLQPGDLLLAQGSERHIEALRGQWDLMLLDSKLILPRTPLAPWALAIMFAVVVVAAFKLLPIHIAALLGVAAMLGRGCVRLEGLGRAIGLEVVLLVASSIALGNSLVRSGAADWLAAGAVLGIADWPPALQIAAIMTLAAALTNFVSNSAAAAIGTPIAVTTAGQLGLPPEPFVLAILFGANLSYATPMAYQTNILVMKAAGYTFRDFVRVGLPLVLLMLGALSYLLVRHFQL